MGKKIVSNTELVQKIQKIEDFIQNRAEGRKSLIKFPSIEEPENNNDMPANVVIAEAFDQLQDVIIGGLDKEGKWWFSMSMKEDANALWILENFKRAIIESAPERDFNEGREI